MAWAMKLDFWVFDYPAKYELLVREHLKHVDEKLNKRGYRFVHLNIFEVLIDMLEERGLLTELASVNCKSVLMAFEKH